MSEYSQPCESHIELRVKTEKELALIGQAMDNHVKALSEASSNMSECTIQMEKQVGLMQEGLVRMTKQDMRLDEGNRRFSRHAKALTILASILFTDTILIAAIHGEKVLPFIKKIF